MKVRIRFLCAKRLRVRVGVGVGVRVRVRVTLREMSEMGSIHTHTQPYD